MKTRGFTLIELLAVIVILAIIALIAVPTIINIIGNAQKSAFKDSAYGIIKAGELYYTNQMTEPEGMTEEKIFTFPNDITGLDFKGSKPVGGTLKVSKEGKVALAINNGRYCLKKGYHENDVTINEDLINCTIPVAVTLNTNITSSNNCIKNTNATCANGTEVSVQVNRDKIYNFYVINDTGNDLTLIMDRNIGNQVVWISSEDYIAAGGTSEDYGSHGNNNKGPLTALGYLEEQTSNWTNVPTMTYTLNDDGGGSKYHSITRTNVRARMLTHTETNALGCTYYSNSCPSYLSINTSSSNTVETPSGYWLSSAYADGLHYAWFVNYNRLVSESNANYGSSFGVRPVITLSKTL